MIRTRFAFLLPVLLMALMMGLFFGVGFAQQEANVHMERLERQQQSIEAKRRALQIKKMDSLRKASMVSRQIADNQKKLFQAKRELNYHEYRLRQTQSELNNLSENIDRTIGETTRLHQDAARRIRAMYMGGRINMLQMVVESNNMASFLDRLYYKQKLVANDKKVLKRLRRRTEQLRLQKLQLANRQTELGQTIRSVDALKETIGIRIKVDGKRREQLMADANYYARSEDELIAESASIARELASLIPREGTDLAFKRNAGSMIWPVVGQITSPFGYRVHPIHRVRKKHTGLDIAKASGSPIRAADGGQVLFAGWRGGYGRAIMINHGTRNGKSIVTLYGHCSSVSVRQGQVVSQGQTIGRVGCTGSCTGPHLHFEVRVNGQTVNPRSYL